MNIAAPTYYKDFRCAAGACRHSCCIGWEIDIDEETAERYRELPGDEGRLLRENIAGDPPHFVLDARGRCPCLTEDNLCRLILTLGEDSLCQICRDHPRFYNIWPGRTEVGLGASCETAAALILSQKTPFAFEQGDPPAEGEEVQALYELRASLFRAAYDGSRTLEETEDELLRLTGAALPPFTPGAWAMLYEGLERLDEAWSGELELLRRTTSADLAAFDRYMGERVREYRNMLAYFLYFHMAEALEDGDVPARAAFAVLSVRLLHTLGACRYGEKGAFSFEDQVDLFRMYSAEVEYSLDNMGVLYGALRESPEA